MKRLIIVAALILAALTMRAQATADSVSVMLRHLANTNREIVSLNRAYNIHAAMIGIGGATMLAGTIMSYMGAKYVEGGDPTGARLTKSGAVASIFGLAFIAASFLPMPNGVALDERGLVVDIDNGNGKRRK